MSENMIEVHATTEAERTACQSWELWESGEVSEFQYDYDQDVQFIVQQGEAVIHTQFGDAVVIAPGNRVVIRAGVSGRWDISSAISNRYVYL